MTSKQEAIRETVAQEDVMTNKTVKELVEVLLGHATNCDLEGCPRVGEYFRQVATTLTQQAVEIEARDKRIAATLKVIEEGYPAKPGWCSHGLTAEMECIACYDEALLIALTGGGPTDE